MKQLQAENEEKEQLQNELTSMTELADQYKVQRDELNVKFDDQTKKMATLQRNFDLE